MSNTKREEITTIKIAGIKIYEKNFRDTEWREELKKEHIGFKPNKK